MAISAGAYHSVALTENGQVIMWGDKGAGFVPDGSRTATSVAAGNGLILALWQYGNLDVWAQPQYDVTDVPNAATNAVSLAATSFAAAALRHDGTVVAWGDNSNGQTNVPGGLSNVVSLSSASIGFFAIKSDRTAAGWGYEGALPPFPLTNVVQVAGGTFFGMALSTDGTVFGWGDRSPPNFSDVVSIAAGDNHSLALLSNGTVVAWGGGEYGLTNVPLGLSNVISISAGSYHSLALKSDGTVVGWGAGSDPNNPPIFPFSYPNFDQSIIPSGLSNVVAISAGGLHSVALVGRLSITSIKIQNQHPVMGFHTFSGRHYTIEYSNSLQPESWTPLPAGGIEGTGYDLSITDNSGVSARFYRLKETPLQ